MGVNYGCNKVRFLSPVKVGGRIRLGAELTGIEELPNNGAQVYMTFTFEIEGSDKPAAVAEIIFRYYG
jgi:acyl dehydratase